MALGRIWAAAACVGMVSAATLGAVPWGYESAGIAGAPGGSAALAYGPDGTLYVVDASGAGVTVLSPGGGQSTLAVTGASLVSIGGAAVSPDGSTLYITDNKSWGDGQGDLYGVSIASGAASALLTGLDSIDDVAVRASGEVFVSEAVGGGAGGVYQVVGGAAVPAVGALDYASGLAFDSAGDLIFQQSTDSFVGQVYRLGIDDSGTSLAFGSPELLAGGLSAGFDLTVDSEDDVFVTGAGGVYQLERDAGGAFLGSATAFAPHGFSTEIGFAPGSDPFDGGVGYDGGHLTYVPEFASVMLEDVTTVPEPAAICLLAVGAVAAVLRRRSR